jgi:hypothetical protein
MGVEYRTNHTQSINDGFSQVFKESAEYFMQTQQVNILGEGFRDVLTDNQTFRTYVDKLVEGVNDASEEENLRTLLENNRTTILQESAVAGIPPIASLSMPTIRKMWAKVALKYAFPTEPVKTPAFHVSFSRPYIQDPVTKEKHFLPEALRSLDNGLAEKVKLSAAPHTLPMDEFDMLAEVGASFQAGDAIDRHFLITAVEVEVKPADEGAGTPAEVKTVQVRSKMDLNNRLYVEVSAKADDGTVVSDVLMGGVDPEKGIVNLASLRQKAKKVIFQGFVSSEAHNRATNVSFDLERRDITIGTGEHIEASLPLEMLTDTMAMYNIDGASEVVDVMSNVTAQKVDQELYNFLDASFNAVPTYRGSFNVHPAAQFAGNPKAWLEEIRRVIDFYATKIKSETYYYQGYFVIVGNPLDTQLIPNVSWTFNHVSDAQNGVEVDYSVGAMSGANRYTIVASDLIPAGELTMFFVPLTNKFMTVKYYPYTFNVVHNYLNTVNPNIPSIMMTKRHTIEEFLPMVCKIDILNNNGTLTAPNQSY